MTETRTELDSELSLENLLPLVEGKDDLLRDAVERLRREEAGEVRDFFKHGNHGSHNSG